eukprot:CAMPEP_0206169604 /NCGR_PEP_ID=MMETSP1474-20131121/36235_1 /ASSEMBLY_ACC=CAM_ASM_001110 /TAXON_ID=97495 /ORGANISM="Imantonia sp., Strain RCC918" /LENGTH=317 /DNA_ID=CAMNT_0053575753 /DNA_START=1 /DNA_END=951 /DNA_ORIENTATION=+
MIATFAILTCVIVSSLMHSTNEIGTYYLLWDAPAANLTYGHYYSVDGEPAPFANMLEIWWWCLQTLTSEGYGDHYPILGIAKFIGVLAALTGTIVLALPIAVIGLHFDDEWGRNRKEQRFDAKSRVAAYNVASFYGTKPLERPPPAHRRSLSRVRDEASVVEDAQFSDQAFNVQADLSLLLDQHFNGLSRAVDAILHTHTEKLTRSIGTDLKTILKDRASAKRRVAELRAETSEELVVDDSKLRSAAEKKSVCDTKGASGFAGLVGTVANEVFDIRSDSPEVRGRDADGETVAGADVGGAEPGAGTSEPAAKPKALS